MSRTLRPPSLHLRDNTLVPITLAGGSLQSRLSEHVLEASLSCSTTEVSELSLTLQDSMSSQVEASGILRPGAVLSVAGWSMSVSGWSSAPDDGGPRLSITAPSRYVQRLRGQTGAKSWGTQDIARWTRDRAWEVGMVPVVQSGLGRQLYIRDKPEGDDKPSTWDLMVEGAEVGGAWLFEHGSRLVLARPSWLVKTAWGGRTWSFRYDGWADMDPSLVEKPQYELQDGQESLTLTVMDGSRHLIRPGDRVILTGRARGAAGGTWLVEGLDMPLQTTAPAVLRCVRAIDPDKADPRTPEDNAGSSRGTPGKGNAGKGTPGKGTPGKGGSRSATVTSKSSTVSAWARRVNGGSYDFDGGYGAQCVDLPKKYNAEVIRGNAFRGNGKDVARNAVRAGSYTWVGPGGTGRVGDIASWDGSWGGGYGHVGIVLEDRGPQLYMVHQNYGRTKIGNVSKRGLLGYARPRRLP